MGEDQILLNEQAALLRSCRAALDAVLDRHPMLGVMYFHIGEGRETVGNLRAELFKYRQENRHD